MAIAADGTMYVVDYGNSAIRTISPSGVVSTLAGNGNSGTIDGQGDQAQFTTPWGIHLMPNGNLLVTELIGAVLRQVTPDGVVTTLDNWWVRPRR